MTAAARTADLFGPLADVDDVMAGLAQLAAAPPLWPIDAALWVDLFARVTAFAWRWDATARAAGGRLLISMAPIAGLLGPASGASARRFWSLDRVTASWRSAATRSRW